MTRIKFKWAKGPQTIEFIFLEKGDSFEALGGYSRGVGTVVLESTGAGSSWNEFNANDQTPMGLLKKLIASEEYDLAEEAAVA